jgi:hypothetical protein
MDEFEGTSSVDLSEGAITTNGLVTTIDLVEDMINGIFSPYYGPVLIFDPHRGPSLTRDGDRRSSLRISFSNFPYFRKGQADILLGMSAGLVELKYLVRFHVTNSKCSGADVEKLRCRTHRRYCNRWRHSPACICSYEFNRSCSRRRHSLLYM